MATSRLGRWSSIAIVAIGVGYVLVLGAGVARHGLHEPIADPVLAVMEVLTLLAALPIVTLMAAVHDLGAPDRKVHATVALVFAALFAGTTGVVHFVELTAVRQLGGGGLAWPSPAYAAELFAWDVFLGLSLVFGACVFTERGLERAIRRAMATCGALCLAGTVGPVVGDMRLQLVGVFGYAGVLPFVAVLLVRYFARR